MGINNLLKDDMLDEYQATRNIVRFIEEKRLVKFMDGKILKKNQMYYTFIEDENTVISCLYAKIQMNDYDGVISIIGPTRINYKKNASILKKVLMSLDENNA
ncbi:TPA: hypothetical protein DEP21_00005 [Patescibacteria group bacterium]|nr:hypothetical protein [Candidatus Gracilibacteria bacterium]